MLARLIAASFRRAFAPGLWRLLARLVVVCFFPAALAVTASAEAEDAESSQGEFLSGVSEQEIRFGQVAALKGPNASLGSALRDGILAAFHEVNRKGGIKGRQLKLESANDSYEPELTLYEAQEMLAGDRIFAFIGGTGTSPAAVLEQFAGERGIPFIGPLTGAAFLRDESRSHVVNFRPSYHDEAAAIVEYLRGRNFHNLAVFYQEDQFGRDGYEGVLRAVEGHEDLAIISRGTYQRNTINIKSGLLDVFTGKSVDAVVLVGASEPVSQFVKWAWHTNFNPTFVSISFVNSYDLASRLVGSQFLSRVLVSQVTPPPWDLDIPVVVRFQEALRALKAEATPDFVALEGYLGALATIKALESIPEVSRAAFLEFFHTPGTLDLGGFELNFGSQAGQGAGQVIVTAIDADGNQHLTSESE